MKNVISCAFNMDTASVEVKYLDGSMLSIYCPMVEDEFTENMYERSGLTWLVYNIFPSKKLLKSSLLPYSPGFTALF